MSDWQRATKEKIEYLILRGASIEVQEQSGTFSFRYVETPITSETIKQLKNWRKADRDFIAKVKALGLEHLIEVKGSPVGVYVRYKPKGEKSRFSRPAWQKRVEEESRFERTRSRFGAILPAREPGCELFIDEAKAVMRNIVHLDGDLSFNKSKLDMMQYSNKRNSALEQQIESDINKITADMRAAETKLDGAIEGLIECECKKRERRFG